VTVSCVALLRTGPFRRRNRSVGAVVATVANGAFSEEEDQTDDEEIAGGRPQPVTRVDGASIDSTIIPTPTQNSTRLSWKPAGTSVLIPAGFRSRRKSRADSVSRGES